MDPINIVLNILFFGITGALALASALAIFIVLKYGQSPVVTILFSVVYTGLFLIGFTTGLTILSSL